MSIREFDPVSRLLRLQQDLEHSLARPSQTARPRQGAFPAVNVFGHREGYRLTLEVPGVAPGDLELEVHGQTLTVSGSRIDPAEEGFSVHRRERWRGEFSRSLQLPDDADVATLRAASSNGVVVVDVDRRADAKPRQIAVEPA